MNKYTTFLSLINFCFYANAQVGINTDKPFASIDVKEKRILNNINDINSPDGIIIPKLTKAELAFKTQNVYTPSNTEGVLVYITDINGTITGPSTTQVEYITSKGYYYLAPDNKWRIVAVKGLDESNDAWVNNPTYNRVELGSTSKGTKRSPNTQVVVTDSGNLGINIQNPSKRLEVNLTSSTSNQTDALRITNLKTLPFIDKSLVIDNEGFVGIKTEENVIGNIQRFPIKTIESINVSETKQILIDSAPEAATNSINTITTTEFIPGTSKTGITLPSGIYKLEVKIVGYFNIADVKNSVNVKILVNDLEYSSQNYGSNTNVANNENNLNGFTVMDFIELKESAEINFTITNNVNTFTVVDYLGDNTNRIYGSLILIQRLK